MTEAFEAAVDLARHLAVGVVEAVHDVFPAFALLRNVQVFHGDQFGDGEAVMDFHHRDFVARIANAGFLVGALRRDARRVEVRAVPGIVLALESVRQRQLQSLDGNRVLLPHRTGDFRRRDDGAGRAVRHAAAIEEPKRFGNHRRIEALLLGDRLLQVRLGILGPVGVTLHRHMCDGAFQIFLGDAVLGAIGGCKLRKITRRRTVGGPKRRQAGAFALRQTAITGVFQFLNAQRQRDVACSGRDGIDGASEGFRT